MASVWCARRWFKSEKCNDKQNAAKTQLPQRRQSHLLMQHRVLVIGIVYFVLGIAIWPHPQGVVYAQSSSKFMAKLVARSFFHGLFEGDIDSTLPLFGKVVNFDGELLKDPQSIRQRLESIKQRVQSQGLRLRQIEVLSLPEAIRRFGPPPRRLKQSLRPRCLIAMARLNTLGVVAILQREGSFYKIVGLTD